MIQPLFEHRLTLAGYDTRVLELEGDGAPILLLHGYADSADGWRSILALLARRGQRAIAVDLPGFATADGLGPGPILPQLDDFAAAAVAYLRGRRRPPVVAVGHSLGGCLALRLAERHAGELAGVVAVAPAGLAMTRLLSLLERDPILTSLLALPVPIPSAVVRAAAARIYLGLLAAPASIDPRVVASFSRHLRDRSTAARYLETARRLLRELRDPFEPERMSRPVLLVWGERDRLSFARGAEPLLEAAPDAHLELLPGIGHCPQVEAPARFAEILLEFSSKQVAEAA
ncbi:MAG: hypothetical protein QOJ25_67 [Solirubrobacteraceae bacterium]|jgi:pimeloyl-ACP methyl ester carboxylesterase|nr:hypothetical protein [Solirubrobacteraceae bacterium]